MSYMLRLASMAIVAGPAILAAAGSHATPILETQANIPGLAAATQTVYGAPRDLIFDSNVSGAEIHLVAEANTLLLGQQVDPLGKVETSNPLNGSSFNVVTEFPVLPSDSISNGALTVTCTSDKCASFDWVFDQSLTTLNADWDIVKFGVKYGGGSGPAYFLVDALGNGADSGSFNILDYNLGISGTFMLTQGDIDDLFQTPDFYHFQAINDGPVCFGRPSERNCPVVGYSYHLLGLSHVDFFGSSTAVSVPEPASLTLLGLGLAGMGFMTRRRRNG